MPWCLATGSIMAASLPPSQACKPLDSHPQARPFPPQSNPCQHRQYKPPCTLHHRDHGFERISCTFFLVFTTIPVFVEPPFLEEQISYTARAFVLPPAPASHPNKEQLILNLTLGALLYYLDTVDCDLRITLLIEKQLTSFIRPPIVFLIFTEVIIGR